MKQQQSITSLPPSPEAERRSRMIKYTIAMSIRVLCIFAMLFVDGWWLAVCAAGAIFLPYIAVVSANVGQESRRNRREDPEPALPAPPSAPPAEPSPPRVIRIEESRPAADDTTDRSA